MKQLISSIGWDLRLQFRYQIVSVAAFVTALYCLIFANFPEGKDSQPWLTGLILTDPCMLGFMFIGALVLFEKNEHTHQALVVTPVRIWQYLLSKALSLSLISVVCSTTMVLVGYGWQLNYFFFLLSVLFSSVLFIWVGFVGVARVKSFNQFLILVPITATPLLIPLVSLAGVVEYAWFYLLPTQASVILFRAAFEPVAGWQLAYAFIYLPMWLVAGYFLAEQSFLRHIIPQSF